MLYPFLLLWLFSLSWSIYKDGHIWPTFQAPGQFSKHRQVFSSSLRLVFKDRTPCWRCLSSKCEGHKVKNESNNDLLVGALLCRLKNIVVNVIIPVKALKIKSKTTDQSNSRTMLKQQIKPEETKLVGNQSAQTQHNHYSQHPFQLQNSSNQKTTSNHQTIIKQLIIKKKSS